MVRRALRLVMALSAFATVSGCYVTRTALHHNDLFNTRRPVQDVIDDPQTSEETRRHLHEVERILRFARDQGLNTDGAYRYYIHTEQQAVSYIVQAAEPDQLKFVTWWFPVVGSVPYIGYFDRAERDVKAAKLEAQGYDVNRSGASAFSSLGWFDDPIFSSMIERGAAETAHLFIHELTHRTLWVPGSVEFNENLAEYVASQLVPIYLTTTGRTELIAPYQAKQVDKRHFRQWLKELKDELGKTYKSNAGQPRPVVLAAKARVFEYYLRAPVRPKFAVLDYIEGEDWNNASVMGASLYTPDLDRFTKAHRCLGHDRVAEFLSALEAMVDNHADPFLALDGLCGER